uniref:Uncharacterized protein n=1 Tax=Anguilla anguilla TaxID=7936 RepID=A0A0E9XVG5_ANGAN
MRLYSASACPLRDPTCSFS